MNSRNILIVEDTAALADLYGMALGESGYSVTKAHSGNALFEVLDNDSFSPDLLILDVKLPDMDGMDILQRLKDRNFNAPVIVITGHGSINMAIDAMRLGASDFLVKPFDIERLVESAEKSFAAAGFSTKAQLTVAEEALSEAGVILSDRQAQPKRSNFGNFIGISQPMQLVYDVIENAAKSNATVFITGESGTGKEICAEAIHAYSRRAKESFIAINCAAIPRELLESELFGHVKGAFTGAHSDRDGAVAQAEGGTLFLDEIAEMAPDMQTKLLRFLQNLTYRKVGGNKDQYANVRIICATNRDPIEEISKGNLRQDLYYRLHVIPIHLPPLRKRKTDIIDLADYYLRLYAKEEGKAFECFSDESESILVDAEWTGNVRELQNVVRGVVVLHNAKAVTAEMLASVLKVDPAKNKTSSALFSRNQDLPIAGDVKPLWEIEKGAIEHAISLCDGNIPKAAALLEISPSTIYRKKMMWERLPPPSAMPAQTPRTASSFT